MSNGYFNPKANSVYFVRNCSRVEKIFVFCYRVNEFVWQDKNTQNVNRRRFFDLLR